jgi:hypothetical protein
MLPQKSGLGMMYERESSALLVGAMESYSNFKGHSNVRVL